MKYFIYYIILFNIMTFITYGIDKILAIFNKNRVSERSLFCLSFFGGAIGALLGMLLFRHKIKKLKFYLWNIFMIGIWGYLIYKLYF